MDADEFVARFRETREAIAIELKYSGEQATIRRLLDDGCALERTALLAGLGYCAKVVVKVTSPGDEEVVAAADERAKAFLRGLLGEQERLDVKTLWPLRADIEAADADDLAILDAKDPNGVLRPFDGWPT